MAANNKQTSDHAKYDHGSGIGGTSRARRLTEMVQEGIASGELFTIEDMNAMQQDVVDEVARRIFPSMI